MFVCVLVHRHTSPFRWTLWSNCLTEVRKACNSCLSASAVTLQTITLLHLNHAGGSGGERGKEKKGKNIYHTRGNRVQVLSRVFVLPFMLRCLSLQSVCFHIISILSVVSLAANASRHTAVATWNPLECERMWTYIYTWPLCVCVYACVELSVEGNVYSGQPLMTISPTGLDLPLPKPCVYCVFRIRQHCLRRIDESQQRWFIRVCVCVCGVWPSTVVYQLGCMLALSTLSMSSKHIFNSD